VQQLGGKRGYEVIWRPLLEGKFGPEAQNVSAVWFWNKLKLRGSSRDTRGKETLAYLRGGFAAVSGAMRAALEGAGVQVHLSSPVDRIDLQHGSDLQSRAVRSVQSAGKTIEADAVLVTTPLPTFLEMAPALPADYIAQCRQIRFLGNMCLVFRLNRSLSSTYWLNVADPEFPFVGIIEHTNFDDRSNYGGEHIAYLSKYLPTTDPRFAMGEEEYFEYCLPYVRRIFPDFERSWVIGHRTWRASYSQPVITKHYSKYIPDIRTPARGLWLSTMAQIYPEDRGTNYAVRHGRMVAAKMIEELKGA
jgi:protoporphyrinogen oxidase